MKKTLFWITFVPLGILLFVFLFLEWLSEKYGDMLILYERWCFDDPNII